MTCQPHRIDIVVFEQAILRRAQHFGKGVAGAYYGSLFIKIRKIHNTLLIKVVGVKPMQLPDISRGTIIGNIEMGTASGGKKTRSS